LAELEHWVKFTWLQWHILHLLFTIEWTIEMTRIRILWPPSTQQRTLVFTLEAKRAEGVKKTKVWHHAGSKWTRRSLRFVLFFFCLRIESPLGPVNYRSADATASQRAPASCPRTSGTRLYHSTFKFGNHFKLSLNIGTPGGGPGNGFDPPRLYTVSSRSFLIPLAFRCNCQVAVVLHSYGCQFGRSRDDYGGVRVYHSKPIELVRKGYTLDGTGSWTTLVQGFC